MTTSQRFNDVLPPIEKSDFSLLRSYIEQQVSHTSVEQLIETIENSKDTEVE